MATLQPHRTTGWYPDPLHEQVDGLPVVIRWWDGHEWTDWICRWNGHQWVEEGSVPTAATEQLTLELPQGPPALGADFPPRPDQPEAEPVPPGAGPPPRPEDRIGRRHLLIALAALTVLIAAATAGFLLLRPNAEQRYLEELRAAGLGGQYSSDANAVASGEAACNRLQGGGSQSGTAGDQIAVKHFCPEFADGFHVLKEITVAGTFTLLDSDYYSYSIATSGGTCAGTAGYSDITSGTPVVLRSAEGKVLAATTLGPGSGDAFACTFSFTLPVTEGESDYVVTVADRGEMHYTFTQLDVQGISLTLGD